MKKRLAVVFCRDGYFLYADRSTEFPVLCLVRGRRLPDLPISMNASDLSDVEYVDADDWLTYPGTTELTIQTLHQRDGYATTLLRIVSEDDDDAPDDGVDDT